MRIQQHYLWLAYLGLCMLLIALADRRESASRTLTLSRAEYERALQGAQSLRAVRMTEAEEAVFAQSWVEQQVLLHEAFRRGLDREDPRVRSDAIANATRSLAPSVPSPTGSELRSFYMQNRGTYQRPEFITLSLVTSVSGGTPVSWDRVRERLASGATPESLGDVSQVGPHLENVSRDDLHRLLGPSFTNGLDGAALGKWHGPIDSTLGEHLIRVEERTPSRMPPFEEVERMVRQDWLFARGAESLAPLLDALRTEYDVRLDPRALSRRIAEREQTRGRLLSEAERAEEEAHLRAEEALLAYARAKGLDRSPYVERRLARKIRFLMTDAIPTPSDAELRAIYDAERERFVPPGGGEPLPFERVQAQLRAIIVSPLIQAGIDERVQALVGRYQIVMGE